MNLTKTHADITSKPNKAPLSVKGGLIGIAGRLAMCGVLTELEEVCENQKTISTNQLSIILERASNKLKDEAVCLRNMATKINEKTTGSSPTLYRNIQLKRELFRFKNLDDWVNNARWNFAQFEVRTCDYIAINKSGLVCRIGKQFNQTTDEEWPIVVYELV